MILDEPAGQARFSLMQSRLGLNEVPARVRQVSPLSFDDSEARFFAVAGIPLQCTSWVYSFDGSEA